MNIYADTETFIKIAEKWQKGAKDERELNLRLKSMGLVIPWLLCYKVEDKPEIKFTIYPHTSFFEFLNRVSGGEEEVVLWFHNATYDLTSFLETCGARSYELMCKETSRHQFIRGWFTPVGGRRKIWIGDTLLYQNVSLRKLGEQLGYPKGEIPYDMANLRISECGEFIEYKTIDKMDEKSFSLREAIEYCKRDVEILEHVHKNQIKAKRTMTKAILGADVEREIKSSTQGTHARELLTLFMKGIDFERDFRCPVTREEYHKMESVGGYTSISRFCSRHMCTEEERISSFDVNSMYPYIMSGPMPYGPLCDIKPRGEFMTWIECWCCGVEWDGIMEEIKNPPIPESKQTIQGEEPRLIYLPLEVYQFLTSNNIIKGKINKTAIKYQQTTRELSRFMIEMYERRRFYKTKEDLTPAEEADDKSIKIAMNSIYGKLCEKTHEEKVLYKKGKFNTEDLLDVEMRSPISGTYVAWMGRLMIYEHLYKVRRAGFKFLYCDTDSIKFVHPKDYDLSKLFIIGNTDLGQWKDEGQFDEFMSNKSKTYALINHKDIERSKFKLSGVSNSDKLAKIFIRRLSNPKLKRVTLEHVRSYYNPKRNILVRQAKTRTILTERFNQSIIVNVDYRTMPSIKGDPYAVLEIDWDRMDYTWKERRDG